MDAAGKARPKWLAKFTKPGDSLLAEPCIWTRFRFAVMFLTWAVARVGLLGLGDASASASELGSGVGRPLRGWRRGLQEVAYWGNRAFFFCMGVHWVTVKGVQVRRDMQK